MEGCYVTDGFYAARNVTALIFFIRIRYQEEVNEMPKVTSITTMEKPFKSGKFKRQLPLHLMLVPGLIFVVIFNYIPMAGLVIAFQKFVPAKGLFGDQKWIGFQNFTDVFHSPNFGQVMYNTIFIASMKIVLGIIVPVIVALLLNEVRHAKYRKAVQTSIFIPFFISWVVLGGIMIDLLSPSTGVVNKLLEVFGLDPIYFLGNIKSFPYVMAVSDVWKGFGYSTIIYVACIAGIDPCLYEAAAIDGAGRWHRTWHITLSGMKTMVVLLTVLGLGSILNAGFDQIFMLYSPQVYETGDIVDTLVYRLGMMNYQYGMSTAVGLFKSLISSVLVIFSYIFAYKVADYRLF